MFVCLYNSIKKNDTPGPKESSVEVEESRFPTLSSSKGVICTLHQWSTRTERVGETGQCVVDRGPGLGLVGACKTRCSIHPSQLPR